MRGAPLRDLPWARNGSARPGRRAPRRRVMRREPRGAEELLDALHHALVRTARPHLFLVLWRWRYEMGVGAAVPLLLAWLTFSVGASATVAIASAGTALLFGWPPSWRRTIARVWCVIT